MPSNAWRINAGICANGVAATAVSLEALNQLWSGDLTRTPTDEDWLYLAISLRHTPLVLRLEDGALPGDLPLSAATADNLHEMNGETVDWVARHFSVGRLVAVGRRLVHGAGRFPGPTAITDDTLEGVAHLGSGVNLCGLEAGTSCDASMALSTLEGIPMVIRPGALDPGVQLHLLREHGLSVDALEDMLHRRSGLLGASGPSEDMRELVASSAPGRKVAVLVLRADEEQMIAEEVRHVLFRALSGASS